KSTYMRQAALITIMAQCGSFVPAKRASIGVCDRVFTRIGASDDMTSGQSTFMVEMKEVADILKYATSKSLLILDEIGRGTSTFDGMSIAKAVIEYCAVKIKAKTLFATHYHELCEIEGQLKGVKNYNIAVKKHGKEIVFIKKIVRGGTSDSYGIDVARLAGLPEAVINRANEVLSDIERRASFAEPADFKNEITEEEPQLSLGSYEKDAIIEKLKTTEPDVLTPIEALSLIYELTKKAKEC
ncbi:MAG: DNA mismatch repair protein MutS, partial [Clostridia bacterium]|nr:DNA mismatch repair protein MutS [Clostridia bacterium]